MNNQKFNPRYAIFPAQVNLATNKFSYLAWFLTACFKLLCYEDDPLCYVIFAYQVFTFFLMNNMSQLTFNQTLMYLTMNCLGLLACTQIQTPKTMFLFGAITIMLSIIIFFFTVGMMTFFERIDIIFFLNRHKYQNRPSKINRNASDEKCIICSDDYQPNIYVTKLPCNHMFHEDCMKLWFQDHGNCPICMKFYQIDISLKL
jgi:hypothetical protein